MCNCNKKRAAYTAGNDQSRKGMVKVVLIENKPQVLNGNVTGRMYVFRSLNDLNWVDKRDVIGMEEVKGLQVVY
jgi:hypothetical protein